MLCIVNAAGEPTLAFFALAFVGLTIAFAFPLVLDALGLMDAPEPKTRGRR